MPKTKSDRITTTITIITTDRSRKSYAKSGRRGERG
jgi:hypothetical protein